MAASPKCVNTCLCGIGGRRQIQRGCHEEDEGGHFPHHVSSQSLVPLQQTHASYSLSHVQVA